MAFFIPSSIQKRLLRYALLRTGLIETEDLDLDSLDITLGRQNRIELKNLRLNVHKLSSLLNLPEELCLISARTLLLRLVVPADIYRGSIVAEVDGIECKLVLENARPAGKGQGARKRSPESTRSPQHRKTNRRIPSLGPYGPDSPRSSAEPKDHVPNTEDLAKSFLQEEPMEEKRKLEDIYTTQSRRLDESTLSESSGEGPIGTGTGLGLPGFLASFLQGIVDRFHIRITNVSARLDVSSASQRIVPASHEEGDVAFILRVGSVDVGCLAEVITTQSPAKDKHLLDKPQLKRKIVLDDARLSLLLPTNMPGIPSNPLLRNSRTTPETASLHPSISQTLPTQQLDDKETSQPAVQTMFHGGGDLDGYALSKPGTTDPLEIVPGDDNATWTDRRRKTTGSSSLSWSGDGTSDLMSASVLLDDPLLQRDEGSPPESLMHFSTASDISRRNSHNNQHGWRPFDLATQSTIGDASSFVSARGSSSLHDTEPILTLAAREYASSHTGSSTPVGEDLGQSRIYSREEAESMYLSTLSQHESNSPDMQKLPGTWAHEDSDAEIPTQVLCPSTDTLLTGPRPPSPHVTSPQAPRPSSLDLVPMDLPGRPDILAKENVDVRVPSMKVTPAESTREPSTLDETSTRHGSDILNIDTITLWHCPLAQTDIELDHEVDLETLQGKSRHRRASVTSARGNAMPGAFSQYAEQSSSVRFGSASLYETVESLPQQQSRPHSSSSIEINIHRIDLSLETSLLTLIYAIWSSQMSSAGTATRNQEETGQPRPQVESVMPFIVQVQNLQIGLLTSEDSRIPSDTTPDSTAPIMKLDLQNVEVGSGGDSSHCDHFLRVGRLALHFASERFLYFEDVPGGQAGFDKESQPDFLLEFSQNLHTTTNRRVNQVVARTKPLCFDVDLDRIDNALDSFGGISGILELSASMISSASLSSPTPSPSSSQRKGVRFEDMDEPLKDQAETKFNARIDGVHVNLAGKAAALNVRSSVIKVVTRSNYVASSIDALRIVGSQIVQGSTTSVFDTDLGGIRLEYLFSPKDADLERLLSLITPSKNKYENDDDILIDTLLRQRRKGAVLKLTIANVDGQVLDWQGFSQLQHLGQEMSSFSAVAKYLPEDDRPGLLILARVKKLRLNLPVNDSFGPVDIHCIDVQAAHIGLPALTAVAVGNVKAARGEERPIIHEIVKILPAEDLPVMMVRMVGDEAEPTLRLKVFNLCAEYSVPLILALTGSGAELKVDEVVDLAASTMLDLARPSSAGTATSHSARGGGSPKTDKKLSVDILLQECAIGLQPLDSLSKAMVVLSNTRFTTITPPIDVFEGSLELRKAAIYISDDSTLDDSDSEAILSQQSLPNRLASTLGTQGFVSVSQIMAARFDVHIIEDELKQNRFIDVDIRDELFVLETCADSTQTLISVMNGLAPPSQPNKEPKFRTEAMTVEDMISSFTGNAFEKPPDSSTLFDASDSLPPEDDDFLGDSMSQSIYGGFDDLPNPEDDMSMPHDEANEVVQSLLEDDPFEMPDSPQSARLTNDELLRHIHSQLPATSSGPVQLEPVLLTPKELARPAKDSIVLGADYRWNTPMTPVPLSEAQKQADRLPLRLRIHDVHLIWNLYDGYDWQRTKAAITDAVLEVENKAEQRALRRRRSAEAEADDESIIEDCLFNSIYVGVPASRNIDELRREINRGIDDLASETESYQASGISRPTNASSGQRNRPRGRSRRLKLDRSRSHKISFELKGVSADVLVFPPMSGETQSSIDVRIRNFEIFDNVPTSTWRKFLTSQHDKEEMREMCKPMVHLEMLNVRPVKELAATEIVLRVSVMPIRLHVDQDALDFITRFFDFKDDSGKTSDPGADQPFIQRLEVNTVQMCLDYKPKRVDYGGLRSGKYTEFKNFFVLDQANITLKHAIIYGIRGFDTLNDTLNDIWMPDIKANQLPGVLSGLAAVSSLARIGGGFVDVVAIPVREYQKDGRLVRSIQKGATHFARNTTSELARFGAKMAVGTQNVLQGAETMLSPGMAQRPATSRRVSEHGVIELEDDEDKEKRALSHYADQPLGVLQGLKSARRHLERDLLTARDAFIAVQGEVLDSGSASGAAAAVARHAPTILLRPVIGASRAVGQTLMGTANQVDRGHIKKMEDKYKRH